MTNRQYRLADFNRALQDRIMRKRAADGDATAPPAEQGAPAEESYPWKERFMPQWTNTATGLLTALLAGYVGHRIDGARGAAIGAGVGLPVGYGAASHFELGDQLESGYDKAKAGVQEWWKGFGKA